MAEFGKSTSGNGSNDVGDFSCNICLNLAQDPIVTLCGHLFCWPCLYKWLHHHSHSQHCPVCKALIQEEKLVPLYGRGETTANPRSKPLPGVNIIPNRSAARQRRRQRPETAPPPEASAPPPEANQANNHGFGWMEEFRPMTNRRSGILALPAALGGLFPSFFNIHVYGTPYGHPYGYNSFPGGFHPHGFHLPIRRRGQQADYYLKNLLVMIGAFVILALFCYLYLKLLMAISM